MEPASRVAQPGGGRLADLHIRLVGGSLLRRTVLSVAAFTMSTCLLLGLISMAAVGATRALVGGADAPADESTEAAAMGDDDATGASTSPRSAAARSAAARGAGAKKRAPSRRTGGAVAPDDALRAAGRGDGS